MTPHEELLCNVKCNTVFWEHLNLIVAKMASSDSDYDISWESNSAKEKTI